MQIINFFESQNKDHWLAQIEKCDWGAGAFLHCLLKENKLQELVGKGARVLLLTNGDELVSFCTLAEIDDVQPTVLTPWIGWIYTFPEHRGHRHCGELLAHAELLAKNEGAEYTHISTNHVGLYEKYGYKFFADMKDIEGESTRVYRKKL